MIDELIKQDFNTFKSTMDKLPILYQCTSLDGVEGIKKNGASREFTGKNSNFYGQGAYTTFTLESTLDNAKGSIYGKYLVKFVLDGGFKDFLFFDQEMNEKYNGGEPIEHQIERLCPPDIVEKLKRSDFYQVIKTSRGNHYLNNKPLSAHGAKYFFEVLKGDRLSDSDLTPWQRDYGSRSIFDEKDLSRTKVKGYVFIGTNDGEVCVVRDYNSLIPLAYFDLSKGGDPYNPNEWIDIFNEDTFNNIAGQVDIGSYIRGDYPETPLNTKTICGYILVKKGGKYNYINAETGEELLPVFADMATDFDPHTGKAKFLIGDSEYEYSSKINMFIEDGCFTYDKNEFEEELRDNGILNESIIKIKNLIERIGEI
jgi:hypothetical protein